MKHKLSLMMNQQSKLIPLTYLGPIELFAHLRDGDNIIVEQNCNYERKSYRNRCNIIGANGPLSLSVPVINQKNVKIKTKDTQISYDSDWQKQHWRSITSAYNSSPFFEYYADAFYPFYNQKFDSLVQFNMELLHTIIRELELDLSITLSDEYETIVHNEVMDLRYLINPKKKQEAHNHFVNIEYWQVFAQKFGFTPNMSILDLIFNMGPESNIVLANSLKP